MFSINKTLPIAFLISFTFVALGAIAKIMHYPFADALLIAGMIFFSAFIIFSIYEVNTSPRIPIHDKVMWTIGLLFFSGFAAIFYMLLGRKRVATV